MSMRLKATLRVAFLKNTRNPLNLLKFQKCRLTSLIKQKKTNKMKIIMEMEQLIQRLEMGQPIPGMEQLIQRLEREQPIPGMEQLIQRLEMEQPIPGMEQLIRRMEMGQPIPGMEQL